MSIIVGGVGGSTGTINDYSRLDNLRGLDLPMLRDLTMGYKTPAFNGWRIAPIVTVPKERDFIPKWGAEAFQRFETLRGLGGDSNVLKRDERDWIEVRTEEHDASYPIDYREASEADFNLQKRAGFRSTNAVRMGMECQMAELFQTLSNYPTDNKITLGSGVNPAKWSDYITTPTDYASDPQNDVEVAKETISEGIGIDPNCIFIGRNVFAKARRHPIFKDLIKYTQTGIISLKLMAEFFDIPNIFVGSSRYYLPNADPSTGGKFMPLWGNVVIVYYCPEKFLQQQTPDVYAPEGYEDTFDVEEPSFAYTVRKEGNPYVFEEQKSAKVRLINYTDNYKTYMTWPEAGYIINDAV